MAEREYITERVKTAIYLFTGCPIVHEAAVDHITDKLRLYLDDLMSKAVESAQHRSAAKTITPTDILSALNGRAEYYGAKRYLITKKHARKFNLQDPTADLCEISSDEHAGDDKAVITATKTTSKMDRELKKLDDGSSGYRESERKRVRNEQLASILTDRYMTVDEYLHYADLKRSKFITNKATFRDWLQMPQKPNEDAYALLGFICRQYVQHMVEELLKAHDRSVEDVEFNKTNPVPLPPMELPIPFTLVPVIPPKQNPDAFLHVIPDPFVLSPRPKDGDDIGEIVDTLLAKYYIPFVNIEA